MDALNLLLYFSFGIEAPCPFVGKRLQPRTLSDTRFAPKFAHEDLDHRRTGRSPGGAGARQGSMIAYDRLTVPVADD